MTKKKEITQNFAAIYKGLDDASNSFEGAFIKNEVGGRELKIYEQHIC